MFLYLIKNVETKIQKQEEKHAEEIKNIEKIQNARSSKLEAKHAEDIDKIERKYSKEILNLRTKLKAMSKKIDQSSW